MERTNHRTNTAKDINEKILFDFEKRRLAGDTFLEATKAAGAEVWEMIGILGGPLSLTVDQEWIDIERAVRQEDLDKREFIAKNKLRSRLHKIIMDAIEDIDLKQLPPGKRLDLAIKYLALLDRQVVPEKGIKIGFAQY